MGDETIMEIVQKIIKEKIGNDVLNPLKLLSISEKIEKEAHRIYIIKYRKNK